jgi:hypothetical protein
MKRTKTRVLIEDAADATAATRALLACLRGIDLEAFEALLVEHESLAGVPSDHRRRDDLIPRIEEAIGKALPASYYLSYEKVRRTGTSGYVLRRDGEEELDDEGVIDTLSTARHAPPDVSRAIERNAMKLGSAEEQPMRPAKVVSERAVLPGHARINSPRKVFRGDADHLEMILACWVGLLTESRNGAWWPSAADLLAGRALVDEEFRDTFDAVCRDALPYARRFVGSSDADEILFFVAYHVLRDFKGAAKRGIDPPAVSRAVIESAVRRMRVTHWRRSAPDRDDPDPGACRDAGKALGMSEQLVRRTFRGMLTRLRGMLDRPPMHARDSDLRAPVPSVHPDFALVGDLLEGVLSPSDELILETRLRNDAHAFERMWPLIEAWERCRAYSPTQRIAALVGGRMREPDGSERQGPRQVDSPGANQVDETGWTMFVGRVGAVSRAEATDETELLSAMRKNWHSAIAEHARG